MKSKTMLTEKRLRRRYDADFKASAVQMLRDGRRISDVSRSLGVNANVLRRWKAELTPSSSAAEASEIDRLRRQVRQLEMERDVLKKALSIFSRST